MFPPTLAKVRGFGGDGGGAPRALGGSCDFSLWLARKLDATSRYGAIVDPLADKVMLSGIYPSLAAVALLLLAVVGYWGLGDLIFGELKPDAALELEGSPGTSISPIRIEETEPSSAPNESDVTGHYCDVADVISDASDNCCVIARPRVCVRPSRFASDLRERW